MMKKKKKKKKKKRRSNKNARIFLCVFFVRFFLRFFQRVECCCFRGKQRDVDVEERANQRERANASE